MNSSGEAVRGAGNELIVLRDVSLIAGTAVKTTILQSIDLVIHDRHATAIVGPSGAGKTSVASIIGGLQDATSGRYLFDGVDVAQLSRRDKAHLRASSMGFVFQASNLLDERTAFANVELGILDFAMPRRERHEMVMNALSLVGLSAIGSRRAALLSGGERHRVALARALVKSPRVIIADEPTASLDQSTGQEVLESLRETTADLGATLVLVTHDQRAVWLCDEVVEVVDGRIAR